MNESLAFQVGARIAEFRRKMATVNKTIRGLPRNTILRIDAKVDDFNRRLDNLANRIRTLGTVAGSAFRGGLFSMIPTLSPIIGSLTGGVGALASSFTALGGGLGAFGIAAIGNAQKLGESMSGIQKINERIQSERQSLDPDQEKINELLNERKNILNDMSKAQTSAMKQVNTFKKAWQDFLKVTQEPVFRVFSAGLKTATSLLKEIRPIVKPISDVLVNLLNQFNQFSKTKQFQSFINFFATRGSQALQNWGQIAGNIFVGFMELMKAFGPLAGDMENGLIGMTKRFSEWAAGLKNSKSFQNFINFVKTNGPKVLDLIGNLTNFIIELGKGMAPLGSWLLDVVNGFLEWTNSLMKANPLIGKVLAVATSLGGVLLALAPGILFVKSMFGGMAMFIWTRTAMMRARLITGIAMMIKSLGQFVLKTITTVAKFVAQSVVFIARWSLMGAKALLHAGKMAAAWTLATGKAMAKATASMVATSAKFVAKWALIGAKSLLHAARVAAAWFIALGPVGWVIATVIGLVALIIANWDKVKKWTIKTWNKVWGWIKDIASKIWNKITDVFGNIVDFFQGIDLYESGKAIIQSAIDGIMDMKRKILGTVENIVGAVRDFWPFSPAKRGPLSNIHRMDFKNPIVSSISKAKSGVTRAMSGLASVARNAFQPNLALADIGVSPVSINSGNMKAIQHAFSADVNDFELPEREDVILEIDGREVGRATFKHVTELQERDKIRRRRSQGW